MGADGVRGSNVQVIITKNAIVQYKYHANLSMHNTN